MAVLWFKSGGMPTVKILRDHNNTFRYAFPHQPESELSFSIGLEQLNPPKRFVA